jgi:hypothetical protein
MIPFSSTLNSLLLPKIPLPSSSVVVPILFVRGALPALEIAVVVLLLGPFVNFSSPVSQPRLEDWK